MNCQSSLPAEVIAKHSGGNDEGGKTSENCCRILLSVFARVLERIGNVLMSRVDLLMHVAALNLIVSFGGV